MSAALGLNKAYLIGVVATDPELRAAVGSASAVAVLSIATPSYRHRKVGEGRVEAIDHHRVTARGETATYIAGKARKGDRIAVECVLRPVQWRDQSGTDHYNTSVVVETLLWIGKKPDAPKG